MSRLKIAVVIIILLLGLFLRLHNYAVYPQRGATSDEYSYSFLGLSLLTKGMPETWSNVAGYKNLYHLTIRGLYFPMVSPYFDHPPLNGLLVGGWALLNGENTYQKIDLATIRLVPIFLSVISSLLVFLLGNKLFGYRAGIWALLIYSTATIFVMNQRVVFAENLWTPLLLGALYLYSLTKKMTFWKSVALGILAGLSFWAKELGIVVFFILFFLLVTRKEQYKYILTFTGVCALFFLGYMAYGYYYDWETFTTIIFLQSGRNIGAETLHILFFNPIIVNKPYSDGWYYVGFLTLFFSLIDYKKYKMIVVPAFLYLLLIISMLNTDTQNGWYMIPLFPFMALSTAAFLDEHLEKKSWVIFLLLLFVALPQVSSFYKTNFGLTTIQFRIILLLLFSPLLLVYMLQKERVFLFLSSFWFYFLILLTIVSTYYYMHSA